MKRDTVVAILAEGGLVAGESGAFDLPEGETATLLFGSGPVSALTGIVRLALRDEYVVATTRRSGSTYIEYELVTAISLGNGGEDDRRPGFV